MSIQSRTTHLKQGIKHSTADSTLFRGASSPSMKPIRLQVDFLGADSTNQSLTHLNQMERLPAGFPTDLNQNQGVISPGNTSCQESDELEAFKPKKVFVSFYNKRISSQLLRYIFSKYGKLRQAYICNKKAKKANSSHCYGFVTFCEYEDAQKLVKQKKVKHRSTVFEVRAIKFKPEFASAYKTNDTSPEGEKVDYVSSSMQ